MRTNWAAKSESSPVLDIEAHAQGIEGSVPEKLENIVEKDVTIFRISIFLFHFDQNLTKIRTQLCCTNF